MDGILNINKPAGMTSHDVVGFVRRLSHQRQVGHAGTLDPAAEGVLVVCLGKATKVVQYLVADQKAYRARITLGISTDTYDAEGRIVRQALVSVTRRQIEEALGTFRGQISQVPPAYSAIKQGGQPLYKLARAGHEVRASARDVTIYELALEDWRPPELTILVRCSKGTYIRSLAHDLGERLGCGAHLSGLLRLASGRFVLDTAVTTTALASAFAQGTAEDLLFALDEALLDYDALIVSEQRAQAVRNGIAWRAAEGLQPILGDHGPVRVYSVEGDIVAMARYDGQAGRWQPSKVF